MDGKLLQLFVVLEAEKAALKARLEAVQKELTAADLEIREGWIKEGISGGIVDVPGTDEKRSLYVTHRTYASPAVGRVEVIQALRDSGLEMFVAENYNAQSLNAYVAERVHLVEGQFAGEEYLLDEDTVRGLLPGTLGSAVKVYFKYYVGNRKKG